MKTCMILLSCLCGSLAISVRYETTRGLVKNTKEYKNSLKDIRLVPINQIQSHQKTNTESNKPEELAPLEKSTVVEIPKISNQHGQVKSREDKQKLRAPQRKKLAGVGQTRLGLQGVDTHQNYMQKLANQLYLAQKHASLLSDYQKYILKQDSNVKNYVFDQALQVRNPKSSPKAKQNEKVVSIEPVEVKYLGSESLRKVNNNSKKNLERVPKVLNSEKTSLQQNDHLSQSTNVKYVTVSPVPLAHFANDQNTVVLPQYQIPQPYTYYEVGGTQKPHVEAVEIPSISPVGLGSSESSNYHYDGENQGTHTDPKYEFMYKVKDHEKHNHFGHMESRQGKATYGYYFVQLPDGRLETVKYWADKTGYHAKVDYHGEAKHPPSLEYTVHPRVEFTHH